MRIVLLADTGELNRPHLNRREDTVASNRIRSIVTQFIVDIEQAVRLDEQEKFKRLLDGMAQPQRSATAASPPTSKPKPKKRRIPEHCVWPEGDGCALPHMGPRHSFLCKQHFDERERAKKQEGGEPNA